MTTPSVGGTPQAYAFADGGSGKVLTYAGGGATGTTTYDVLCVNSDTVVSTPSGWTLAVSKVSSQGSYIFYRQSGTTTATVTTSGNFNASALWIRIVDTGGPDTGAATFSFVDSSNGTSSPSLTTPALAASGELALAFLALHSYATTPATYVWSSGYTEAINGSQGSASSAAGGSVATKAPAGTAAETPSVSWTNLASDRYLLFVAFSPATSADAISPTGIAVTSALGSPTVSQALSIAPTGIAVTAAVGSPTVLQGGVAPAGIAVSAALGSPTVAQAFTVAPTGIATAAALGSPTVSQALAVVPSGIAVPVALGSPTVSQTIPPGFAISPTGFAVSVAVGSPTLSQAAPARTGGWNTLSAIAHEARQDAERDAERRRNPIDCPEHGWPLEITPRGRHCMFGGHVV